VAVIVLGPVSTAVFYIAFTIATAIDVLSLNLGNQLTAEMSRARGEFRDPAILFVWRVWGAIAALSLGMIALAPYVLDIFGAQYRSAGTTVFRVLLLAAVPRSILFLSIAATRAKAAAANDRRSGPIILLLQATTCILTWVISLLTMHFWGILGMALGWTIASTIGATIAIVTVRPPVLSVLARRPRSVRRH
jgi:O-antigen/teichoic acid export membrane protein